MGGGDRPVWPLWVIIESSENQPYTEIAGPSECACFPHGQGIEAKRFMDTKERVALLRVAAPNSWIALAGDESRCVAYGATYAEAVANAEREGESDPVLIKTPEDWLPMVFMPCA